jgi:hypothetical protein
MSWDEWEPLVRVGRPKFNVSAGGSVKVRLWIKGQLHDDWRGYFGSQVSLQRLDAAIDGFDSGWDNSARVVGSVDTMSAAPAAQTTQSTTSKCSMPQLTTQTPSSMLMSCRSYIRGNRSMSRPFVTPAIPRLAIEHINRRSHCSPRTCVHPTQR